jgi:hypothetical protein
MAAVYEIEFRGAKLLGVRHNGSIVIAIRPICTAIGIDDEPQRRRINRDPVLSKGGVILTLPFTSGGPQSMLCLALKRLHYWLAGISSGSIKDETMRQRVIEYQEECADYLFACFMPEAAAAMGITLPAISRPQLVQDDFIDRMVAPPVATTWHPPRRKVYPFGFDPDDI